MSELSPEAQGLLDVAREGDEMPSADKARHRRAILAQIAVASAAGAGATLVAKTAVANGASIASAAIPSSATAASTTSVAVGTSVLTKIVGVVLAVGAVAGGTVAFRAVVRDPVVASRPSPSPVGVPVRAPATVPAANVAPVAVTTPAEQATPAVVANARPIASAKPPPSPATETTRPPSLEDETLILRGAHEALQAGNASRALALLDEHARTYPHGLLVEERGAQRIFALCALGSTARARAEADVFLSERPNSPLAPRVRASCIAK